MKNAKTLAYIEKHIKSLYPDIYDIINTYIPSERFTEKLYCYINKITVPPKCKTCKLHNVKFHSLNKGYNLYCSSKCGNTDTDILEKRKKTYTAKYGVDNPFKSKTLKNKSQQTCLAKYGTLFANQNKEVRDRINISKRKTLPQALDKYRLTCLAKYGTSHPSQNEYIKHKSQQTCISKYGVTNPNKLKEFRNKFTKAIRSRNYRSLVAQYKDSLTPLFTEGEYRHSYDEYIWKCNSCGQVFKSRMDLYKRHCPECKPRSMEQQEIVDFIRSLNIDIRQNDRTILGGREIDIYIPQYKIGIEYDGLYWHSEDRGMDKFHHIKKYNECINNGIRLIRIFSDEWNKSKKIVKSRIKHILNGHNRVIYARKCEIKIINSKTAARFLSKYHLQGRDRSTINLGGFYKNRLIGVMTFSKRKITRSKELNWELVRYCTVYNFSCVGLGSKLLKYFERNYVPNKLIAYADKRWSNGNMYIKLGFKHHHDSAPNYWYTKHYDKRLHRFNFQKRLLQKKMEIYDPLLSEKEIMSINGWDRIWDCGNMVFTKEY